MHCSGVVLVHQEPPEARKPSARWRLYVFKNGEQLPDPLHIHRWGWWVGRAADIRLKCEEQQTHATHSWSHRLAGYNCRCAT